MRNIYIDRLRGLAILMVVTGHSLVFNFWPQGLPDWVPVHISNGSYYGVSIFFVISGFLITGKFKNPDGPYLKLDMREFYVKRIGRIIPALILLMIVSGAIAVHLGADFSFTKLGLGILKLLQLDFFAASELIPRVDGTWKPLWSLAVEEAFYIFLPIVALLAVTQARLSIVLMAAIAIGMSYRSYANEFYSFFATFDQLAVGGLLALYAPTLRKFIPAQYFRGLRWGSIALIGAVYLSTTIVSSPFSAMPVALCAALYILGSPDEKRSSPIPLRVMEGFGILSYEIYLFHMLILWATISLASKTLVPDYFGLLPWMFLVLRLLLIYLLALAVSKFYADPLNRLIRAALSSRPTAWASDQSRKREHHSDFPRVSTHPRV